MNVDPGKYLVTPVLPPNLTSDAYSNGKNTPITIEDTKCASKVIHIVNDSEISGKVVDITGKPVSEISLELIERHKGREDSYYSPSLIKVDKNGDFSIKAVRLGSYQLAVNYFYDPEDGKPYPTKFFPNSSSQNDAEIFNIGP